MDAFEGIHSVRLSPSPPADSGPGYEVVVAKDSGIAVYASAAFLGKAKGYDRRHGTRPPSADERCAVGRLVDLDLEGEGGPARPQVEGGAGGGAGGGAHYSVSRLRSSSLEIRERGAEFLREQLEAAQEELKLKGEECEKLSHVRNQLEQELEELTASLFEEAHKMVREANVKQATAQKQLKEAQGKIDVLQAEVAALKTLVLTSTPSSPNRQLHPQLQGLRGVRGHSHGNAHTHTQPPHAEHTHAPAAQPSSREDRELAVPALLSLIMCLLPGQSLHVTYEPWQVQGEGPGAHCHQLDSVLFAEFLSWRERPTLDRSSAFICRVHHEDISPCLSFTRSELSQSVQIAVESNSLTIEPVAMTALPMVKASAVECGGPNGCRVAVETKCALSGMSRPCRHRIKLGDKENFYYISPSSRARITAVCNFFTYIRYIQQGLVRQDVEQMFWEVMRLRREMTMAKLGFFAAEES